ncbi:MAG: hypothetical protein SVG88_13650 [Halobacteriales archaeon]|nr:hypothetical protein [Halobacteriales archaeon]
MDGRQYLRILGIGIACGWIGGAAMFVSTQPKVMAFKEFSGYPVLFVILAGVFSYLFARSLGESIYTVIVCFLSGIGVMMAGQIAPLYILGYTQASRNALIIPFLAQVVTVGITKFLYYLVIGYMASIGGSHAFSRWQSDV